MAIISLTIGAYSNGEILAEEVSQGVGARCVSREVLLEASRTYNVPETKISQVFEKTPNFWERMTESRRTFLVYIQATLAEWAKSDALIYYGHAGQELLRKVPHVLRVRVDVPLENRIKNVIAETDHTSEQARRLLAHLDDDRSKRLRYFFNSDWRDISLYDMVMNTEKLQLEDVKQIILDTVRRPQFQLTDEKRVGFNDFLVKCRIYALLASALVGRLSLITVTVNDGVVTLSGTLTSHEAMIDQFVLQIQALEGVRQVNNEIMVGVIYHEWNV